MNSKTLTRRTFVAGTTALTAGCILGAEKKEKAKRKIKLGVVGCGGRGAWITNLFNKDGGYEIFAVADYFQKVADRCGDKFKVDKSRRFSGLSGYKKLLASGVEAAAFIVPPYFFQNPSRSMCRAALR